MKILITGLPYFGNKIREELTSFDPHNQYIYLNTYYSNKDRIKFLLHIWSAKTVYSINGATGGSFVLWLAIFLRKHVVFHWVGTDVMLARQAVKEGKANSKFLSQPVHVTDSPWFVADLKEIEIQAEFQPLLVLREMNYNLNFPSVFSVLCYLPAGKEDFYGVHVIHELALKFPEIRFQIAGSDGIGQPVAPNLIYHGWVKDMEPLFFASVVTIRWPKHDGLSFFVLESMAYGRYVIYNHSIEGVCFASGSEEIIQLLSDLKERHQAGKLELNMPGRNFVTKEFHREKVLGSLQKLVTGK
jgi:hypothetical protein